VPRLLAACGDLSRLRRYLALQELLARSHGAACRTSSMPVHTLERVVQKRTDSSSYESRRLHLPPGQGESIKPFAADRTRDHGIRANWLGCSRPVTLALESRRCPSPQAPGPC